MTYMPPLFEGPRRSWHRMDRVVRLIIANWALGMAGGALIGVALLAFDFLHIRSMLFRSDMAVLGSFLFLSMFAFTFGGVCAATAAMRAGDDDDEPRGGRRAPAYAYATVKAAR